MRLLRNIPILSLTSINIKYHSCKTSVKSESSEHYCMYKYYITCTPIKYLKSAYLNSHLCLLLFGR